MVTTIINTLNNSPIMANSASTPNTIPITDANGTINTFITSRSSSGTPSFAVIADSAGTLYGWGVAQNNLTATTDPTITSDSSLGYATGSFWLNISTNLFWVCLSATVGAAKWNLVSQDSGLSAYGRIQIFNSSTRSAIAGKQHFLGQYLDYTNPLNLTASQVYYHRNWLNGGITITKMECAGDNVSVAGNINMGIYSETGASVPGTLLAQTGSTAIGTGNTSNFITVSLQSSWTVPSSGYYWFAFIVGDATNGFVLMPSVTIPIASRIVRVQTSAGVTLPTSASPAAAAAVTPVYVAAVE